MITKSPSFWHRS